MDTWVIFGRQDLQDTGIGERYRPEPQGARYPHHRSDSGQGYHRYRGPEPRQAGRVDVFGRAFAAVPGVESRTSGGDRSHDPERELCLRPGEDAPPARGWCYGSG